MVERPLDEPRKTAWRETSPWNLGGLTVRELAKRVWEEFWADEVMDRAAALSYYFVLAFFPALLFLAALLGYLPVRGMLGQFLSDLDRVLPPDSASIIRKTLHEILTSSRGSLVSIGALVTLWAASSGMASVMIALNVAYHVRETRPWWKRRLIAVVLTLGFALLVLTALILLIFGPQLGGMVAGWFGLGGIFPVLWNVLSMVIIVFFVLIGIALVDYCAPSAKQHWRWVTPGSVLATGLWLLMSYGLRMYVASFANYSATYGSLGGVILLMFWLYLGGIFLLLGAEVNSEIENAAARRGDPTAKAPGEKDPGQRASRSSAASRAA
ncbi:MAG TPA: YihY/virulence factor BrkB family protein [Candidatus Bathyarchaeia archaeon]|nr:YihY/virulence factor BrkB family protein [Candidatus Bathyarchaeia archaeon]